MTDTLQQWYDHITIPASHPHKVILAGVNLTSNATTFRPLYDWLNENKINSKIYFPCPTYKNGERYMDMDPYNVHGVQPVQGEKLKHVFYFTNKEDAIWFKTVWS